MTAPDLAYRINRIQSYLGFPKSEFPELEAYGGIGWVEEEFSKEDMQLKREEQDSEWVGEELSSLDKQLKLEEKEDELASWGLDGEEESSIKEGILMS